MYQALYRKYRPKTFDDVVGQEVVIQTLKNAVLNNKINHAYLFSGTRGCGKTSIAKIFSRLVNCENPINATPCGKCVFCTQNNEQNLDIIEMDAASNNGVDEIREINNKVNLVPTLGKYKVYIIDEVHMLTIGAFNALLKTLEEPPAHVIFILATTDPHKIPTTILSRCQRFDLKKISEEKISNRIKVICENEKIEISEEAVNEIAHLGDGSLRDALSALDQVISYKPNNITLEDIYDVSGIISQKDIYLLVNEMLNKNISEVIKNINNYNSTGKSMIKITEEIILYFRNLILSKTAPEMVSDNIDIYNNINNNLTIPQIIDYIKILNETLLDMKKFTNTKMFLELAFIKMIDLSDTGNEKMIFKNEQIKLKNFPGNKEISEQKVVQPEFDNIIDNEQMKDEIKKVENIEQNKNNCSNEKMLVDENTLSKLNQFIDIRVSNTLSNFSKKQTTELKQKLDNLNDYIMDDKYGEIASMILDGQLKAVGNEYIIFTYNTINLVNLFIENIMNVEKLLKKSLCLDYKVIAVDIDKWDEIKEKFNSKTIQYVFEEEKENIEDILKKLNQKDNDNIQSLFGDLVEYE